MIRKKLKTGLLSAALAISVLLVGGKAMTAQAAITASTTSSGWGTFGLISTDDLSVTMNALGKSEMVIPDWWRAYIHKRR